MRRVNLSSKNRDYAVFTPAISGFYVNYVSKQRYEKYVPDERIPAKFENGIEGLNFLNKDKGYFVYETALYSAGHAELDLQKAVKKESMIHERDRKNTILIGDSGGFQISKGVWQGNWTAKEGKDKKTDKQRGLVLNWLENTANYSMVLDIPTNGMNIVDEKTGKPLCGLNSYEEFREGTIQNNKYFFKHRQGKTKFLNVLQGSTYEQADDWFETVCLPIVEETSGWAFGGVQKTNLNHSLRRILLLKEFGLLDKGIAEWMHFLGTGKASHAVIYTAIQRALRKHVNPTITISYDAASPFLATANGKVYTHNMFSDKSFGYMLPFMVDDKTPMGKNEPWPWDDSPVGERLTWGDINYYNPGDLNKLKKEGDTSWDSFSYFLLMGHNVYKHIDTVQMACRLTARPLKQMMTWVPLHFLEFADLAEELIAKDYNKNIDAIDHELQKHNKLIQKLSKTSDLRKGSTFESLFAVEDNKDIDVDDMYDEDSDHKLEKLEESIND